MNTKTARQSLIPTLTVSKHLLSGLEGERYQNAETASRYGSDAILRDVSREDLTLLRNLCEKRGDKSEARYYGALLATFDGEFGKIPKPPTPPT